MVDASGEESEESVESQEQEGESEGWQEEEEEEGRVAKVPSVEGEGMVIPSPGASVGTSYAPNSSL